MPAATPPLENFLLRRDRDAEQAMSESPASVGSATSQRVVSSAEILRGDREILIQHGDQTYRLRVTRANRLILNK